MPSGIITVEIDAPSTEVFALPHDYSRRLEWDTLLSVAYLEPPVERAEPGAVSVCVGKRHLGKIALRTRYVTLCPPRLEHFTFACSRRLGTNRQRLGR